MKSKTRTNQIIALLLCLVLIAPTAALAKSGKKYFKQGQKHEMAKQWDKAAEQYALAINEDPANSEYQLHYVRALTNASLMFMERGREFAEKKDYQAAYQEFHKAYMYDRSNKLALAMEQQMLQLQGIAPENGNRGTQVSNANVLPVKKVESVPRKRVKTDFKFAANQKIRFIIDTLAERLGLNVLYDETAKADTAIKEPFELKDVTAARALELFLLLNKLAYDQVDIRTIVIYQDGNQQARQRYQQMMVRTFYLSNADITEVRTVLQTTGIKQLAPIKNLNALIVRDTPENLELAESIIRSLDKDRSEVIVDINLWEVSRNDLLQIGNQLLPQTPQNSQSSPGATLSNLGGLFTGNVGGLDPRSLVGPALIGPLGIALAAPASAISFLQGRSTSRLIASSQVRAFENEQTSTKIGSKVPIQTASVFPFGSPVTPTPGTGTGTGNTGGLGNTFGGLGFGGLGLGGGYPQIQYQDVGLVIEMTPAVFSNGDVQMKMKIESTGVLEGPNPLTPVFTQRAMQGTARVQNGQTSMIAGIMQNTAGTSRSTLPIIGLLPIIGNLFSVPKRTNDQTDIIVTVTPHILRTATIKAEDHIARASGNGAPNNNNAQFSIQEIVDRAEDAEYEAKRLQVAAEGAKQPSQAQPVKSSAPPAPVVNTPVSNRPPSPAPTAAQPSTGSSGSSPLTIIENSPPPTPTGESGGSSAAKVVNKPVKSEDDEDEDEDEGSSVNKTVAVLVRSNVVQQRVKGDIAVFVIINGEARASAAALTLTYNPEVLQFKEVRDAGLFRAGDVQPELQQSASGNQVSVTLTRPSSAPPVPARGQLVLFYFTAIAPGESDLMLEESGTELRGADGQVIPIKIQPGHVTITQQE